MTDPNTTQPVPADLDDASLDLVVGGAMAASDARRRQEADEKANCDGSV